MLSRRRRKSTNDVNDDVNYGGVDVDVDDDVDGDDVDGDDVDANLTS